jgi:ParB/RepB/Spo0J family partition protein
LTTAIAEQPKKLSPPPIPADAGSPTVNIPVTRIVPSPWNRKADVDDLVESVRKNGVVQNVVLRPHKATEEDVALYCVKSDPFAVGDQIFQLVAGERRWGAAKKAGRSHVPAAIRQLSDIEAMDFQIDENENRKNLRPMERAEAYDRLRMLYQEAHAKEKDYTEAKAIEAVAASRNCSSRTVYDIISLKKLTQNVQHALRNGELETSHGVVLAGRSPEDQEKLLLWMRQQTHHSQGDIPAVRRLKLEIRNLDAAAEEQKRQVKLFKDGPAPTIDEELYQKAVSLVREVGTQVGYVTNMLLQRRLTKVDPRLAEELLTRMERESIVGPREGQDEKARRSYNRQSAPIEDKESALAVRFDVGFDGKRVDLIRGAPLPISVQGKLLKVYPGLTTAHFLKDCRVQLAIGLNGKPFYLTVNELQNVLTTGIAVNAPPAKAPTAAELKRQEQQRQQEAKAEELRREKQAKAERERERNARIDKTYDATFFQSLATKAHVCSRMLTHVVPNLIFDLWENQLPIEAFAQTVLGWPAPKDGNEYSYTEVKAHCVKHTRKFGAKGVLPAMLITLYQNRLDAEKLAKYFGVDPKKLRKQAAAKIAEEERIARTPKIPATQEEKLFYRAIQGDEAPWSKMRKKGATDVEIRKHLSDIFDLGGGFGSKVDGDVDWKGGKDPQITFNSKTSKPWPKSGHPLRGPALIATVRDFLKIPEKGDVDA